MAKSKIKFVSAVRIQLGVLFVVFGANGFLNFIPQPPLPAAAGAFLGALAATGYMFPLIKGIEILAGAALLSNRFVPLAVAVLAPIVVNIVAFHVVLAPMNPIVFAVLAGELFLAWSYRERFAALLVQRPIPSPVA